MDLMKAAFPPENPDQLREDIDYGCGEDESLV